MSVSTPAVSVSAGLTRGQLQARLMGFADRYLNTVSEATDLLEAELPTPECRFAAHATKYYPSLTVLSLAAEAEPEVALLDLLAVVTLERMVWEGAWSEEMFKEHASILTKAQQAAEADIWGVAASVMTSDQIAEMRALIEEWRRQNPDKRYVSSTRFDDFAALRDQRRESSLSRGFLAPVDDATRAVDETRLFGERAMFLLTHTPLLLQWQAELLIYELALKPEVKQLLQESRLIAGAADKHAEAVDRFALAVQKFPEDLRDHREALIKELEHQEGALRELVADVRAGLKDAESLTGRVEGVASHGRELAASLERTVAGADTLVARFASEDGDSAESPGPAGEPARAFDIREYTDAAERLTGALQELNRALAGTDQLLASPSWSGWMGQVDEMTERRVGHAGTEVREWIDRLFWRGAALVVLIGAVIVAARRLGRPAAAK